MNRQTLQLREKVLAEEHPQTLTSMKTLAKLLRERGMSAADLRTEGSMLVTETLQLKLNVAASKKRKAEHQGRRDLRGSTRMKGKEASS